MPDPLDEIVKALAGRTSDGLASVFVPVRSGVPYLAGDGVRTPGTLFTRAGDFAIPASAQQAPIDFIGVYMVAGDYLVGAGSGLDDETIRRVATDLVMRGADQKSLLIGLGVLARIIGRQGDLKILVEAYREVLAPDARARFDSARVGEEARVPLARQPLLAAFKKALVHRNDDPQGGLPVEFAALLLSHCAATELHAPWNDQEDLIGRLPARLAIDVVTNQGFNSQEDVVSLFDRTLRLWRDYGDKGAERIGGRDPATLVAEITGLEIEDLLAMAFAIWAQASNWAAGDPVLLNPALHPNVDESKWGAFLALIAATPDELASAVQRGRSHWDFLPFQEHPVIRFTEGLLLIDETYLVQRVTQGLYWLVHDYLRGIDDRLRADWTQAWGDMVEAHAEDELRALAPTILGGGTSFYDEHDIAKAYGEGGGRADVTIDFGTGFGVFEIVSGQLTVGSRIEGDPAAFKRDLEKLIYKKARQLDGTARKLIEDQERLTGAAGPPRRVRPVVVTGGGLPVNPVTVNEAADYCAEQNLLDHALAQPAVLIDLGELEMLEGMHERGYNALDLIDGWQASNIAALSLRNWLLQQFGGKPDPYRPARIAPRIDGFFDSMIARLGFSDDQVGEQLRSESDDR